MYIFGENELSEVVFGQSASSLMNASSFSVTFGQHDKQNIMPKHHIPLSLEEKKTLGKHNKGMNFKTVYIIIMISMIIWTHHTEIKLPINDTKISIKKYM